MSKPTHILVGTDFSRGGEVAMEMACAQAQAFGAKLTLVHVYAAALDVVDPKGLASERLEIGKEVHGALAKLKRAFAGRVADFHAEVIPGDSPVRTICNYARNHGVDLIVLGAHGRSAVTSLLVGSTAERVARHAACSVLLARAATP